MASLTAFPPETHLSKRCHRPLKNNSWFCAFPFLALSDLGSAVAERLASAVKNKVQGNWKLGNFPWMTKCLLYFVTWHWCYQETSYSMKTLTMEKKRKKGCDGNITTADRLSCLGSLWEFAARCPDSSLRLPSSVRHCPPSVPWANIPWERQCLNLKFTPDFVCPYYRQSSAFPYWVLGEPGTSLT